MAEIKIDQQVRENIRANQAILANDGAFLDYFNVAVLKFEIANFDRVGVANVACSAAFVADAFDIGLDHSFDSGLLRDLSIDKNSSGPRVEQELCGDPIYFDKYCERTASYPGAQDRVLTETTTSTRDAKITMKVFLQWNNGPRTKSNQQ